MELKESNIEVSEINDFPSVEEIQKIQRGIYLKINLIDSAQKHQQVKGEQLKKSLPNFSIGIHMNGSEINIKKLITDDEITEFQDFFELCAKEYGVLGERLINEFIVENDIPNHDGFPLKNLNGYFGNKNHEPRGKMGEWNYYFHGFHCLFVNRGTKQEIEVPLTYGEEFGELDPYFFSTFIKTTAQFQPLPIHIYDDYGDGKRILETMYKLGKFEMINSNLGGREGYIIKDRIKKEVKQPEKGMESILVEQKIITKQPIWKRWFKRK
ncbi:MAG: hypothetical protein ACJA1C_001980 [Crocinitomicaceae bacterium]|jgi:hypothetical protein